MTELFDPVNNEFLTRSFPNSPAATSRLYLLCRCSHQLHSADYTLRRAEFPRYRPCLVRKLIANAFVREFNGIEYELPCRKIGSTKTHRFR